MQRVELLNAIESVRPKEYIVKVLPGGPEHMKVELAGDNLNEVSQQNRERSWRQRALVERSIARSIPSQGSSPLAFPFMYRRWVRPFSIGVTAQREQHLIPLAFFPAPPWPFNLCVCVRFLHNHRPR